MGRKRHSSLRENSEAGGVTGEILETIVKGDHLVRLRGWSGQQLTFHIPGLPKAGSSSYHFYTSSWSPR